MIRFRVFPSHFPCVLFLFCLSLSLYVICIYLYLPLSLPPASVDLREAACDCLMAITTKGMDAQQKVRMMANLELAPLVNTCLQEVRERARQPEREFPEGERERV